MSRDFGNSVAAAFHVALRSLLLLLLLLNEKIMVACCQRLRGHRTVSKVRASVLWTRNCQNYRALIG